MFILSTPHDHTEKRPKIGDGPTNSFNMFSIWKTEVCILRYFECCFDVLAFCEVQSGHVYIITIPALSNSAGHIQPSQVTSVCLGQAGGKHCMARRQEGSDASSQFLTASSEGGVLLMLKRPYQLKETSPRQNLETPKPSHFFKSGSTLPWLPDNRQNASGLTHFKQLLSVCFGCDDLKVLSPHIQCKCTLMYTYIIYIYTSKTLYD